MASILVKPTEEARIHLPHVVLNHAIKLLRAKVRFKVLRQFDVLDEFIKPLSLIGVPYRLIPNELNRITAYLRSTKTYRN